MNNLGIIVCSTISLTQEVINASNIETLILSTTFSNREIKSHEVSLEEYFNYIEEVKEVPKTSQPATGEIVTILEKMIAKYNEVLVITPSINLSGTNQNVHLAISMLPEAEHHKIKVIDSKGVAMTETILCERANQLSQDGQSLDEMLPELEKLSNGFLTYGIPGSLTFLKRSGRVNLSQLLIGKLVNLKIMVKVEDNEVSVASKGRGYRSIFHKIEEEIKEYKPKKVYYTSIREEAKLTTALMQLFAKYNLDITVTKEADIVSGTHFGPNSFGFTFIK